MSWRHELSVTALSLSMTLTQKSKRAVRFMALSMRKNEVATYYSYSLFVSVFQGTAGDSLLRTRTSWQAAFPSHNRTAVFLLFFQSWIAQRFVSVS